MSTELRHAHPDQPADEPTDDEMDRRGFLKCMAWAGTGAVYVMQGGVLKSYALGDHGKKKLAGELIPVHDELPQAFRMENHMHRVVREVGFHFE